MPIYGFHCDDCGHEFATLVTSSDAAACPSCESTGLTRQLSLIARPVRGGETDTGQACAAAGDPAMCGAGPCCMMQRGGCA
ncbi:MAG: zinc ribbon domain-containing protein [Hyphomicrobiaceae bacterium]|nr:zinc ribbon domain-containing protein [Hyphomicrobiaceae bacterium]